MPQKFRKLLSPGKIQAILSVGNLTASAVEDYLKQVSPQLLSVTSSNDEQLSSDYKVVRVEDINILLLSDYYHSYDTQHLAMLTRKLDVQVCVYTYQQGSSLVEEDDGVLYLQVGSCTGAFDPQGSVLPPSFSLLDVQGRTVTVYQYTYLEQDDSVKVDKTVFEA